MLSADPRPGQPVAPDTPIDLEVSSGKESVPLVVGKHWSPPSRS